LGAGLKIQHCEKVLLPNCIRGSQGPNWAVEPYDDEFAIGSRLFGRSVEINVIIFVTET
jgi:hypothetical protein